MKAIRVHQFGGPEVLKFEEVPTPKPDTGQVLVRVRAAGVNPYDTYMRAGTYAIKPQLPYTPGSDAAGTVEAVGTGVTKVKPGDRVYRAQTSTGAYAEYTLALEEQVHRLPENISFEQAASLIGWDLADRVRSVSIDIYRRAAGYAEPRGQSGVHSDAFSGIGRGGEERSFSSRGSASFGGGGSRGGGGRH